MNIFIDSNILYEDYYFESKFNKQILEYCKKGIVNIYMSDIVKLELRHQLEKELEETSNEINKLNKKLKRLSSDTINTDVSVEDVLQYFDDFYDKMEKDYECFRILNYKNEFLPYIVNKAIKKEKPFAENKSEFKDTIIWKTYSDFVEREDISNCILFTNNTTDFCQGRDKSKVHEILAKDSSKFKVINDAFHFMKAYAALLEKPTQDFKNYAEGLEINKDFAIEALEKHDLSEIKEKINEYLERHIHYRDIFEDIFIYNGELICRDIEVVSCEDFDYEILDNRVLVSGEIKITCEIELIEVEYETDRDFGYEVFNHSHVASTHEDFIVWFNFDVEQDELISNIELTLIKLI